MIEALESFLPAGKVPYLTGLYAKSREVRSQSNAPFLLLSAILSDIMFRIPAIELIEGQRDHGTPSYSYLFNWPSPAMGGALGACHGLEIGFVFGNYDAMFCSTGPEADKLSRCMQDAWLAFARTGKPGCPSIGEWPVYGKDRLTMILDRDCYVEKAPLDDERRAWDYWKPEMYPLP
jgi:para-nitrobenzyl esterase